MCVDIAEHTTKRTGPGLYAHCFHIHHAIGAAGGSRGAIIARRLVLRLGVIGVVSGAVDSCATSGGALLNLMGFACSVEENAEKQNKRTARPTTKNGSPNDFFSE